MWKLLKSFNTLGWNLQENVWSQLLKIMNKCEICGKSYKATVDVTYFSLIKHVHHNTLTIL